MTNNGEGMLHGTAHVFALEARSLWELGNHYGDGYELNINLVPSIEKLEAVSKAQPRVDLVHMLSGNQPTVPAAA